MAIRFYDYAPAPSPRRARMVLAEKGIEHENVQIDLMRSEQLSDEFRRINPNCTVPSIALEDGTCLFDNLGIAIWAEAFQPDPPLMGESPAEKGLIGSWMTRLDHQGGMAFMEAYRNSHRKMADRAIPGPRNYAQIPALAERGFARLADFLEELNNHLSDNEYIATGKFTCADIWAFSVVSVTPWIKAAPDERHPHVLRWRDQINQRPSAKL